MLRPRILACLLVLLTACNAAESPTATPAVAVTFYPTATSRPTTSRPTDAPAATSPATATIAPTIAPADTPTPQPLHPLTIASMRQREYPGSDIVIEETLASGSNYNRYYVSYLSEGL
jgi:hypothetical protein